jgi:hypothetical protein
VRAIPLVVDEADDEGVVDRDGPRGEVVVDDAGSVDWRRPAEPGGSGFFAFADIMMLVCKIMMCQ